jgi:DNA-binding GntR family transcriptional regulator
MYVVALTAQDVREIYEVRAALETAAARLLIERGTPEEYTGVAQAMAELRAAAGASDPERFVEADLAFHEAICLGSGNRRLVGMYRSQSALLKSLIRTANAAFVLRGLGFGAILHEHEQLFDAIRRRETRRMEELCEEHLSRSAGDVIGVLPEL